MAEIMNNNSQLGWNNRVAAMAAKFRASPSWSLGADTGKVMVSACR
jgi:hypothetical protein